MGNVSRTPQIESLEAWARMLKPSMVVGVRAGAAERHLEGSVWLLLVTSEAFAMPENLVHATGGLPRRAWAVVRLGAA